MRNLKLLPILLLLTACGALGIQRPTIDGPADAIATTSAEIESVADQVHALCGNEQPGGECLPGAVLDTGTKEDIRDRLQEAQDAIVLANSALAVNDAASAQGRLAQADAILRLIRDELARRTQ